MENHFSVCLVRVAVSQLDQMKPVSSVTNALVMAKDWTRARKMLPLSKQSTSTKKNPFIDNVLALIGFNTESRADYSPGGCCLVSWQGKKK